ncbi:MAG: hypothetical protein WC476_11550 [Phycisphaerae bacterium]
MAMVLPLEAFASYDLILTGIHDYNAPVTYSNETILIDSNAFVRYTTLTLQNCTVEIAGSAECILNLTLNNSTINVKGTFKAQPGIIITETGPSSIIATGDAQNTGKLTLEGAPVNSDYVSGDTDLIVFEAGCSPSSSLKFVDFFGGWCNVDLQNIRLNDAISNCRFFGADYAIYEEGPDALTDIRFSFFYDNYQMSIFADMSAAGCGYPQLWLDNVLIDNAFEENAFGVGLNLAPDTSCYGFFKMTNSIITNSDCGWGVGSGYYIAISISNVAYYGNNSNNNWGDTSGFEINPMFLTESPFEGPVEWPYFIKPDSPVAHVDLGYDLGQSVPQQLLTSLFMDSSPRSDKGIGFGVPISNKAPTLKGDLDDNYFVNGLDFAKFATEWKTVKGSTINPPHFCDAFGYSVADFDKNGTVDAIDLSILCQNWLCTASNVDINNLINNTDFAKFGIEWRTVKDSPTNPVHFPDASGFSIEDFDKNGTVDILDLSVFCENWLSPKGIKLTVSDDLDSLTITSQNIPGLEVDYYAFFLDGKYIATRDPNNNPTLIIDKSRYSKGTHSLEAVIRVVDGNEYLSAAKSVAFNSSLHDLQFTEMFDPGKYLTISGEVEPGYTANIAIKDIYDVSIWSGEYAGKFIAVVDPVIFSSGSVTYSLSCSYAPSLLSLFSQNSSIIILASSWAGEYLMLPLEGPPNYATKGLVIAMFVNGWTNGTDEINTGTCRFAAKIMDAKGVYPLVLKGFGGDNMVTLDMLRKVLRKYPRIRYVHIDSHGNNSVDGPWFGINRTRTALQFNDGHWVVLNSRYWTDRGLPVPGGYVYLSGAMEKAPCLALLNFELNQIKIGVIGSCYSLRNLCNINGILPDYIPENAYHGYQWEVKQAATGQNTNPDYPFTDMCIGLNSDYGFFLGSGEAVTTDFSIYPYYTRFFNNFWLHLKEGDDTTAGGAYFEAYKTITNDTVLRNHRYRGLGVNNKLQP